MKTRLTTEQSHHLIDLGVPKEKASLILPTDSYEIEDISITTGVPIFNLEDFLNGEILPKEIGKIGAPEDKENLVIYWLDDVWNACYAMIREFYATELIDALYELACWYYGEYLKTQQNQSQS